MAIDKSIAEFGLTYFSGREAGSCDPDFYASQLERPLTQKEHEFLFSSEYETLRVHAGVGVIVAKKDGKCGLIDFEGKTIVPFEYDYITVGTTRSESTNYFDTMNKVCLVEKNGLCGLFDIETGKEVVPCEFDYFDLMVPSMLANPESIDRYSIVGYTAVTHPLLLIRACREHLCELVRAGEIEPEEAVETMTKMSSVIAKYPNLVDKSKVHGISKIPAYDKEEFAEEQAQSIEQVKQAGRQKKELDAQQKAELDKAEQEAMEKLSKVGIFGKIKNLFKGKQKGE